MAASSATQASTPRDFQRNDVVRDTSRPNQPPGVVLNVNGGTVTFRLPEQSGGATRVVKAKVADVELAPPTAAGVGGSAGAAGKAPKPFRNGERAVVLEDGVARPVRIVKVGGRTATVVFTDRPATPGGAGKVDVLRLQRPVAAETTGPPPMLATAAGSGQPPLPTDGAVLGTAAAKPAGRAGTTDVELAHEQRVPQATVETAADLLALRTKQRSPSGPATEAALREAVGREQFRHANGLLRTAEGRDAAESLLYSRKATLAPGATPKPPTKLTYTTTATASHPAALSSRRPFGISKSGHPNEMAVPKRLRGLLRQSRPNPVRRTDFKFESVEAAQDWALQKIPGLREVDFSEAAPELVAPHLGVVGRMGSQ